MSLKQPHPCVALPTRTARPCLQPPPKAAPSVPAGEHVTAQESAGEQREVGFFDSTLQGMQEALL